MTLQEWQWKYTGQAGAKIHVYLLEDKEAGIVGHYGGIPLKMVFDGREINGITPVDTMIHPKFRSFVRFKNLYLAWEQNAVDNAIIVSYGFSPYHIIRLSIERLGIYHKVGAVSQAVKQVGMHSGISRYSHQLFPLDYADPRIDCLWNKLRNTFKLAIIRDSAYLRWRYERNPLFSYELWGLRKRWSKDLSGIVVLKRENAALKIMDLLADVKSLPVLLIKVENLAYSIKAETLQLWLSHHYHELLKTEGFEIQETETTIPASAHRLILPPDEIYDKLFFTMGDTDFI